MIHPVKYYYNINGREEQPGASKKERSLCLLASLGIKYLASTCASYLGCVLESCCERRGLWCCRSRRRRRRRRR
jgi:hypothetical protein